MLLDAAGVNAFILYRAHGWVGPGLDIKNRRDFLRSVAEGLMAPLIHARSVLETSSFLPPQVKLAMDIMGYPVIPAAIPTPPPPVANKGERKG